MNGGKSGSVGINTLIRKTENNHRSINFGGKNATIVREGDRLRIETPGGGAWGSETSLKRKSEPSETITKKSGGSLQKYIDGQNSA
jgi:N-methylhydantoinase B/oxoprolinase/acetone carboxylase alpha subunit